VPDLRSPRVGTVLRLDARRTAIVLAVPALACLGIAAAWRGLIPGVASWESSVAAIAASVRLVGPVAATLACWAALRAHRLDYLRTLSARSPVTGPLLDLLLLCGVALLAYVIVALVIIGDTLLQPAAPGFHPLGLPAGAAALAACVVTGYVAGRLAPRPLTAAVVAAMTTSWSVLRPAGSSWLSLLPPAAYGPIGLNGGLRPGLAADQLVWALALGTAIVAGYMWRLSRHRMLLVPLALGLALTTVATVRLHGYGGSAVTATPPTAPVCRTWPLTVCVHPALAPGLPSLEAVATPLATRLTGTPGGFRTLRQLPGAGPAHIKAGVAWVHLTDLGPGYERRVAHELVAGLHTAPCDSAYAALVDAWLLGEPAGGPADPVVQRRFAGWTDQRRRTWLRTHYPTYRACALSPADFPRGT